MFEHGSPFLATADCQWINGDFMKVSRSKPAVYLVLVLVGVASSLGWAGSPSRSSADYQLVGDHPLGAPNFWDYLTYDPGAHRLYAAHVDRIEVVDVNAGKSVGQVGPLHDAHGVAIVPELGKGYADSGDDGVLNVFSLGDLHIIKSIKVSADADGVIYDPASKDVLVVAGDSHNLTIVSAAEDRVVRTVDLPGKPEFLAVDGHNHAFVNIADTGSLSKVDLAAGVVLATWKLEGCERPHGLAYDPAIDRLFASCANRRLIVVNAGDGRNLASLPIGSNSDAVVVDSKRRRVFSANGDGTLTIVSEGEGDRYTVQRTVPTFFGGRNMAIDPGAGTLFVAHGNMKLVSGTKDLTQLRFGWDGLDLAVFEPLD
jgi:DNA-binding beta-propeller fold protein YncE